MNKLNNIEADGNRRSSMKWVVMNMLDMQFEKGMILYNYTHTTICVYVELI